MQPLYVFTYTPILWYLSYNNYWSALLDLVTSAWWYTIFRALFLQWWHNWEHVDRHAWQMTWLYYVMFSITCNIYTKLVFYYEHPSELVKGAMCLGCLNASQWRSWSNVYRGYLRWKFPRSDVRCDVGLYINQAVAEMIGVPSDLRGVWIPAVIYFHIWKSAVGILWLISKRTTYNPTAPTHLEIMKCLLIRTCQFGYTHSGQWSGNTSLRRSLTSPICVHMAHKKAGN
jgi:hypothetical protein